MAKKAKKVKYESRIPVEFGGVSLNKEKARIGFSVDRGDNSLDLEGADSWFAGAQLQVELEIDPKPGGDADGQQTMGDGFGPEADVHEGATLSGVADVMRFSVAREKIGASLVFNINEVDVEALTRFRNSKGNLSVRRIGDADTKSESNEAQEAESHDQD